MRSARLLLHGGFVSLSVLGGGLGPAVAFPGDEVEDVLHHASGHGIGVLLGPVGGPLPVVGSVGEGAFGAALHEGRDGEGLLLDCADAVALVLLELVGELEDQVLVLVVVEVAEELDGLGGADASLVGDSAGQLQRLVRGLGVLAVDRLDGADLAGEQVVVHGKTEGADPVIFLRFEQKRGVARVRH